MAQTAPEGTAVHRPMLVALLVGIELFPDACRTQIEHAAPVIAHIPEHLLGTARAHQRVHFVKSHIRRGDLRRVAVQQRVLDG